MNSGISGISGVLGYLGPSGTHSEEVVRSLNQGNRPTRSYPRIDAVIRAVENGEIAEGVVPIENSLEGSVNITLDTLAHEVDLVITGEVIWPVKHYLLSKPDTGDIQVIVSHTQALAQCRNYLTSHYPEAELRPADSTAQAAMIAASAEPGYAAIGSLTAGQVYGLAVAAAEIQDYINNSTRFVTISRTPAPKSNGEWKTSLAFQINGERPGSLCEVLSEFASRKVNLTKIESRPARTALGDYIFFIDIQGSLEDKTVHEAFDAVMSQTHWFKNLGSYPVIRKG